MKTRAEIKCQMLNQRSHPAALKLYSLKEWISQSPVKKARYRSMQEYFVWRRKTRTSLHSGLPALKPSKAAQNLTLEMGGEGVGRFGLGLQGWPWTCQKFRLLWDGMNALCTRAGCGFWGAGCNAMVWMSVFPKIHMLKPKPVGHVITARR